MESRVKLDITLNREVYLKLQEMCNKNVNNFIGNLIMKEFARRIDYKSENVENLDNEDILEDIIDEIVYENYPLSMSEIEAYKRWQRGEEDGEGQIQA